MAESSRILRGGGHRAVVVHRRSYPLLIVLAIFTLQWTSLRVAFIAMPGSVRHREELQPGGIGASTSQAKGLVRVGASEQGQRGHVATGVFKRSLQWLRTKFSRKKKPSPSTYDTFILKPMLARIESSKSIGSGGGLSSDLGTYESVILEPMLKRIQTPRGVSDGVPPPIGAKRSMEEPEGTASNQVASGGMSSFEALIMAASEGDAAKAKKIVESGANPNEQDAYGWTALRYAVRSGHMDATLALIELGADVNLASKSGRCTPLMSAAGNGLPDMVKMLLKAGADHKAINNAGETAFRISMRGGVLGCAECRVLLTIS
eukprot:CAMPEP_0115418384 /NCGR_PEP_ID=MMETSP0271-20121206/24635_1 /TAXON_ID=71861 /ORGANISM="Scrippsiella trochoidea, Strain CCMP3099" /LENGTH=318 /DNA_ID=CAMNT_0002842847 /DNA_START=17 /DNA_END=973 /DNA_ORIENTATION=-